MEVKDYLIIFGYSFRSPKGCYRELEINQNDIVKFCPLIKEIENLNPKIETNISIKNASNEFGQLKRQIDELGY